MVTGSRHHGERGQVLPLVAFGLLAIIGSAALAVDAGYWRYEQRLQQSAADSAAIAGGIQSDFTPYLPTIQTAGRADAAANGFTNGVNNTTVTIDRPSTGPNAGNPRAVEAIVTKQENSFFSQLFGQVAIVSTRAVAVPSNNGVDCIVALNRKLAKKVGITINGSGNGGSHDAITAPNCSVLTDSIITINGSSTVTAQQIGYVGGDTNNGNPSFPEAQPTAAAYVPDPCASISACYNFTNESTQPSPYPTGAPTYDSTLIATTPNPAPLVVGTSYTYYPGVYTVPIAPPNGSTVTFTGGVYTLDVPGGTSLSFGGTTSATGTGVVFYNEAGAFTISGNGTFTFSPPSSGQFNGLVYYQPASNTSDVTWDAHANTIDFQGTIYMPGANLTLNGNAPNVTTLIVDNITINGGGITAAPPGGSTTRGHFVLAE